VIRESIYGKSQFFLIFICVILLLHFYHVRSNLAEATSPEVMVSIMAVGDSIGYNIENENLSNLSSIIHNSTDIFIFNLEGVLADDASLSNSSPSAVIICEGFPSRQSTFVSNSTFVDYLKLAPITIANLANNHVFDCSAAGINETKKVLKEKNILSVGAG
jgi:hypothetical protein